MPNLNSQQQQHLRSLRKTVNRSVTSLKNGDDVVISTGWSYGRAFAHDWTTDPTQSPPERRQLHCLFPEAPEEGEPAWHNHPAVPQELLPALDFFWPGPLVVAVRSPETRAKIVLACPWRPLICELLSRHGAVLWEPLEEEEERYVRERRDMPGSSGDRLLLWPEEETLITPTFLDASTVPWRLMEQGFVGVDELRARISTPFLLSEDRAFPRRALRTFQPQHKTVVLEAATQEILIEAINKIRQDVAADVALRIYVDEAVAHNHFPDERAILVYGEMSDPERVRRRLEAMLERQRRRGGKRMFVIAISELTSAADSLKKDLEKMSDNWVSVEEVEKLAFHDL